jgi:hypothetical protein
LKTFVTASLLTMLLMAATSFAGDRSDPSGVPVKGIEGPDVRHSQMEARHGLEWLYAR